MAANKESTDVQVAAGLTTAGLLSDEGLAALGQVLQGANDPAAAIAHAVFMALSKVKDKLEEQQMTIDPSVWVSGGGVLDRVLFEVISVLVAVIGFKDAANPDFVKQVKGDVIDLMDKENGEGPESPDGGMEGSEGMPPQGMPMGGSPEPQGGLMGGMPPGAPPQQPGGGLMGGM